MAQVTKNYQLIQVTESHPVWDQMVSSSVAKTVTSLGLTGVTGVIQNGVVKITAEQSVHDQLAAAGHQEV